MPDYRKLHERLKNAIEHFETDEITQIQREHEFLIKIVKNLHQMHVTIAGNERLCNLKTETPKDILKDGCRLMLKSIQSQLKNNEYLNHHLMKSKNRGCILERPSHDISTQYGKGEYQNNGDANQPCKDSICREDSRYLEDETLYYSFPDPDIDKFKRESLGEIRSTADRVVLEPMNDNRVRESKFKGETTPSNDLVVKVSESEANDGISPKNFSPQNNSKQSAQIDTKLRKQPKKAVMSMLNQVNIECDRGLSNIAERVRINVDKTISMKLNLDNIVHLNEVGKDIKNVYNEHNGVLKIDLQAQYPTIHPKPTANIHKNSNEPKESKSVVFSDEPRKPHAVKDFLMGRDIPDTSKITYAKLRILKPLRIKADDSADFGSNNPNLKGEAPPSRSKNTGTQFDALGMNQRQSAKKARGLRNNSKPQIVSIPDEGNENNVFKDSRTMRRISPKDLSIRKTPYDLRQDSHPLPQQNVQYENSKDPHNLKVGHNDHADTRNISLLVDQNGFLYSESFFDKSPKASPKPRGGAEYAEKLTSTQDNNLQGESRSHNGTFHDGKSVLRNKFDRSHKDKPSERTNEGTFDVPDRNTTFEYSLSSIIDNNQLYSARSLQSSVFESNNAPASSATENKIGEEYGQNTALHPVETYSRQQETPGNTYRASKMSKSYPRECNHQKHNGAYHHVAKKPKQLVLDDRERYLNLKKAFLNESRIPETPTNGQKSRNKPLESSFREKKKLKKVKGLGNIGLSTRAQDLSNYPCGKMSYEQNFSAQGGNPAEDLLQNQFSLDESNGSLSLDELLNSMSFTEKGLENHSIMRTNGPKHPFSNCFGNAENFARKSGASSVPQTEKTVIRTIDQKVHNPDSFNYDGSRSDHIDPDSCRHDISVKNVMTHDTPATTVRYSLNDVVNDENILHDNRMAVEGRPNITDPVLDPDGLASDTKGKLNTDRNSSVRRQKYRRNALSISLDGGIKASKPPGAVGHLKTADGWDAAIKNRENFWATFNEVNSVVTPGMHSNGLYRPSKNCDVSVSYLSSINYRLDDVINTVSQVNGNEMEGFGYNDPAPGDTKQNDRSYYITKLNNKANSDQTDLSVKNSEKYISAGTRFTSTANQNLLDKKSGAANNDIRSGQIPKKLKYRPENDRISCSDGANVAFHELENRISRYSLQEILNNNSFRDVQKPTEICEGNGFQIKDPVLSDNYLAELCDSLYRDFQLERMEHPKTDRDINRFIEKHAPEKYLVNGISIQNGVGGVYVSNEGPRSHDVNIDKLLIDQPEKSNGPNGIANIPNVQNVPESTNALSKIHPRRNPETDIKPTFTGNHNEKSSETDMNNNPQNPFNRKRARKRLLEASKNIQEVLEANNTRSTDFTSSSYLDMNNAGLEPQSSNEFLSSPANLDHLSTLDKSYAKNKPRSDIPPQTSKDSRLIRELKENFKDRSEPEVGDDGSEFQHFKNAFLDFVSKKSALGRSIRSDVTLKNINDEIEDFKRLQGFMNKTSNQPEKRNDDVLPKNNRKKFSFANPPVTESLQVDSPYPVNPLEETMKTTKLRSRRKVPAVTGLKKPVSDTFHEIPSTFVDESDLSKLRNENIKFFEEVPAQRENYASQFQNTEDGISVSNRTLPEISDSRNEVTEVSGFSIRSTTGRRESSVNNDSVTKHEYGSFEPISSKKYMPTGTIEPSKAGSMSNTDGLGKSFESQILRKSILDLERSDFDIPASQKNMKSPPQSYNSIAKEKKRSQVGRFFVRNSSLMSQNLKGDEIGKIQPSKFSADPPLNTSRNLENDEKRSRVDRLSTDHSFRNLDNVPQSIGRSPKYSLLGSKNPESLFPSQNSTSDRPSDSTNQGNRNSQVIKSGMENINISNPISESVDFQPSIYTASSLDLKKIDSQESLVHRNLLETSKQQHYHLKRIHTALREMHAKKSRNIETLLESIEERFGIHASEEYTKNLIYEQKLRINKYLLKILKSSTQKLLHPGEIDFREKIKRNLQQIQGRMLENKNSLVDCILTDLEGVLVQGSLEDDLRFVDKLECMLKDIDTFETPRFFKISVQLEIAKKYVQDIISLKRKNLLRRYYDSKI